MEDHIVLKNGARQDAIASGAEPGIEPSQFQQQSPISKGSNTTLVDASGGSDACDSKSPTPVQVSSQEIEYLFLNFSTHLPAPSALPGSRSDKPALPEPPDLKPYTSPFEWPNTRKYVITVLACTVTVLSAAAAGCYSPPEAELTVAWGISGVVYNIGITIFTFGFAIAPMVSAPFSEINGRRPMFIASGILFVVCQIGCGVTRSFPGMILARFFLGVGGFWFDTARLPEHHGFDIAQSSAVFTSMSVGAIIAFFISTGQEKIAKKLGMMPTTPEGRLYFVCVGSILMPAGMFWFGWTSGPSTHWIWPALAVGCATIGIFSIYLAVFNYLADTYHRYASSALAAQSCCQPNRFICAGRNLLGGAFPLVTRAMYNNLGYPEASSLLGGIGSLLTIVPWVLAFFGPKIRARSKFASEIMAGHE
ncbi:hypothetical protein CISG_07605 [Coccidioides immitis RMSCC 3703]|uniref:Uncharacterized protein n=1 Tax=Coccidioides immitis RMSCC 3703 TaxID=454286 RepID=A0A0J8TYB4_COCIT|nr:hypothetical protein CISG_07605 [Coccidioides immitis RMSCC 3703]